MFFQKATEQRRSFPDGSQQDDDPPRPVCARKNTAFLLLHKLVRGATCMFPNGSGPPVLFSMEKGVKGGQHDSNYPMGCNLGFRSRPMSTRSVSERSPMILRIGPGNFLTSVGSARIWSPRASLGFSKISITSIL